MAAFFGPLAPVEVENTATELKVEGRIPEELAGTLMRDGPNPIKPGPDHHWFAGDAMVHGIGDMPAMGFSETENANWLAYLRERFGDPECLAIEPGKTHFDPELACHADGNRLKMVIQHVELSVADCTAYGW